MKNLTVAELGALDHLDLGVSDWYPIEQKRVDIFADATDDHQWIHVDTERAESGPFGTTIAHGYLTLALLPHLIAQLLTVTDQARGTNYGVEKIRFTNPVPVGSDIRLAAEIVLSRVREDGGVQYNVSVRVEIQGHDRPALVGESIYLAYTADVSQGRS